MSHSELARGTGDAERRPGGQTVTRVGLVACGKRKLTQPAPARELYSGPLFRAASAYAAATYDVWFILSAFHGLVEPDQVLIPYERPMTQLRQADRDRWGGRTASALQYRLHKRGLSVPSVPRGCPWPHEPQVQIFIHAGRDYVTALWFGLGLFPSQVVLPVEGLGIGQQLHWYAERTGPSGRDTRASRPAGDAEQGPAT